MLELEAAGWQARPGRFVRLVHATGVVRPYSLAAAAWEDPARIQLHIRLLPDGALSSLVQRAEIGDRYEIEGPLGKCCYRSSTQNEPILLIGSGTGLAPLYGIATDALHQGHAGPIHLFHGAATGARLYFRDELRALQARHPNFHYHPCVDAEPVEGDELGSPLALALAAHPGLEGYKVYVCGHPDLVKTSQRKCFLAGANLKDIAADAFAPSAS
jgi:NAD(P)H-flavin reductase